MMRKAATFMTAVAVSALAMGTAAAGAFEKPLALEQSAFESQAGALRQQVSRHNAQAQMEILRRRGGDRDDDDDGRRGGDRGGWRGGGRDGDDDGWRGRDRGRWRNPDGDHDDDRGGWRDRDHGRWRDRDGDNDDWRPRPGPGRWGRWGHPGWGRNRGWVWRGGRWVWWGWTPWYAGGDVTCDVYYANRYRACSEDAWLDNDACQEACASAGYSPACAQQCDFETRNAVMACEYSYRRYWNCDDSVLWPPFGIVIRIP